MIILYFRESERFKEDTYIQTVPSVNRIIEKEGKLYLPDSVKPLANDVTKVGWLCVPEQSVGIPDEYFDEDGGLIARPPVSALGLIEYSQEEMENVTRDVKAEIDELKAKVAELEVRR